MLSESVLAMPKQSPADSPIDGWYRGPLRGDLLALLEHLPFEWNRGYVEDLLPAVDVRSALLWSAIVFALGGAEGVGFLRTEVKGGAGQAIQSFNLMMGWDERLTLAEPGLWP